MAARHDPVRPEEKLISRPLSVLIGLALSLPAAAQNVLTGDFDGHGLTPPATDGRATDPLTLSRPGLQSLGSYSFGAIFEYGNEPLARYLIDGDQEQKILLLQHVPAINLSGQVGLSKRVAVGLSLPFFPATTSQDTTPIGADPTFSVNGPALGDLQLRVPIGLVLPKSDGSGASLAVAPYTELPTGSNGRFVADAGVTAGVVGLFGVDLGPIGLTANLGGGYRGTETSENISSGVELLGGVGGSYGLSEALALHAEIRGAALPGTSPVEGLLGIRGRADSGLWWGAGLGTGLTGGAGASKVRAFAGIGYSKLPEDDPSSLPAEAMPTELVILDANGQPVANAAVFVGSEEVGMTDADGRIVLPANTKWRQGVEVRSEGFEAQSVAQPDGPAATVALTPLPVGVPVAVRNQDGSAVSGTVTPVGATTLDPVAIDANGVALVELPPGDWDLQIDAEGYGGQSRSVVVEALERSEPVQVLLLAESGDAELVLDVTDRDGRPLTGVAVRIDGAPVGETGDGGRIAVRSLAAGEHDIEVLSDAYQSLEQSDLMLSAGENSVGFPLRRLPGSVLVMAHSESGPVPDVSVRFEGPSRLPAAPLGTDGERIFPAMRPGTWEVWAVSPDYGLQRRELVVDEHDTRLLTVDFQMQKPEGGSADLRIAVVDPDGQPLEGVDVQIDGQSYGSTSSGGAVEIAGLAPGPRSVSAGGEHFVARDPESVFLIEGVQEKALTLDWRPGTVRVSAVGPEAPVEDGKVRFAGASPVDPGVLDADGLGWFEVGSGDWAMLVTSETHGIQQRMLAIPGDSRRLTRADIVFGPPENGNSELSVTAVAPDGTPVVGAAIALDGIALGSTSSGGTATLQGLAGGRRALTIDAPLFKPYKASSLSLRDGSNDHKATLKWSPGAVQIQVSSAGSPVTDATVRFAGPEMKNPLSVDDEGEAWSDLQAGTWQALVTSPTFGLQAKSITLDGSKSGPHKLSFDLQPAGDAAELVVRVVGPDGSPVSGASVQVAGETSTTPDGGVVLLTGLKPGSVDIEVTAEHFKTATMSGTILQVGPQERILQLAYVPVQVSATVQDGDGNPLAATLAFDGPAALDPVPVTNGKASFVLPPGDWQILASADGLGVKSEAVELAPGTKKQDVAFTLGKAQVETTASEVKILGKVQFDLGKATLRAESSEILEEVAATLLANNRVARVEVQGHTDPTGGNVVNLKLSQQRAEAVVAALVARGVAPERLVARGFGSTLAIADNDSEDGRALNRRVQFEILEMADGE
ncbi:MAG: OmpA family protein [Proteobacteria bacterium]|nr:OmpA family protein [Pseudomonadota bacterium]